MKENTSVLPKTTTLHHDGNLACASFPYSTRTSALQKITLHRERNIMHTSFPSMTITNALPHFTMKES